MKFTKVISGSGLLLRVGGFDGDFKVGNATTRNCFNLSAAASLVRDGTVLTDTLLPGKRRQACDRTRVLVGTTIRTFKTGTTGRAECVGTVGCYVSRCNFSKVYRTLGDVRTSRGLGLSTSGYRSGIRYLRKVVVRRIRVLRGGSGGGWLDRVELCVGWVGNRSGWSGRPFFVCAPVVLCPFFLLPSSDDVLRK